MMDLFNYQPSYPAVPGFKARETSAAAAEAMKPKAATLRAKVLDELRNGPGTADELSDRLHIDKLSIRPRCSELAARSRIRDSGARRPNGSGKSAIVWELAR